MTLNMPSRSTADVIFNFCSISIYVDVLWQFRDEVRAHHLYSNHMCTSQNCSWKTFPYRPLMFLSRSIVGYNSTRTRICIAATLAAQRSHYTCTIARPSTLLPDISLEITVDIFLAFVKNSVIYCTP